jgi:hypothetical protein
LRGRRQAAPAGACQISRTNTGLPLAIKSAAALAAGTAAAQQMVLAQEAAWLCELFPGPSSDCGTPSPPVCCIPSVVQMTMEGELNEAVSVPAANSAGQPAGSSMACYSIAIAATYATAPCQTLCLAPPMPLTGITLR